MFNSLWHHGLQYAMLPCPSPTPGVYPNSRPLSRWWHPTISSSVVHFSCLQSFPASGSFPMSQLFTSGGQSIGVSASTSVLPMNTQDWSPLEWSGWISLNKILTVIISIILPNTIGLAKNSFEFLVTSYGKTWFYFLPTNTIKTLLGTFFTKFNNNIISLKSKF